jgi:acetyl esterase/lipase
MRTGFFLLFTACLLGNRLSAQEFIPLWPAAKKPNFNGTVVNDSIANERIWKVGTPGMYAFRVPQSENKGVSILICPGGGFERVSYIYNGFQFAKWFNSIGINVYVLLYRLPHQADLQRREIAAWQDAQRAMRILRANANKWDLQPNKIGVMGISAGGYVASTLGTHTEDVSAIDDSLDRVSFRPDFMLLLSPVITMKQYAHPGSKKNLLGSDTTRERADKYSNELHVTAQTPPAFIVHAANDNTVPVQNSLLFYSALVDKKINASLHVFPQGAHGIKLRDNPGSVEQWTSLCEAWMNEMNITTPVIFKRITP